MLTTLGLIVGVATFGLGLYKVIHDKRKLSPSMPAIEVVFDNLGTRFLFTVISNNPNGSEIKKKPLRVERVQPYKRFRRNDIYNLHYQDNDEFLKGEIHHDKIPEWLIKGQKTFVAPLKGSNISIEGVYKLTFYTKDGNCSQVVSYTPLPISKSGST